MGARKSISFSSVPGENISEYTEKAKNKLIEKFGDSIINEDGTFNVKIRVVFETKPEAKKATPKTTGTVGIRPITVNTKMVIPSNVIVQDEDPAAKDETPTEEEVIVNKAEVVEAPTEEAKEEETTKEEESEVPPQISEINIINDSVIVYDEDYIKD